MTIISLLIILVLGWILGAALNYLADVLPRTRRFSKAVCLYCDSPQTLINYILMRRCPSCGSHRAIRAHVVQGLSVIGLGAMWLFPPERFGFWLALPYMIYFAVVFIIDVEHRVILHEVSIAGAILMIPLGIYWNGLLDTLIGGATGFAMMLLLYYFGILFNRAMAKRRGEPLDEVALGFGDVNLSGVLGILLGWPKIAISLVFSVILGGIASAIYLVIASISKKYKAFTAIPYAPFLIIAAVILIYLA